MRSLEIQLSSLSSQARKLNNQLSLERTRNNTLSEDAQQILKQLQTLEAEINALRERAGMSKIKLVPSRNESDAKGGAARPAELEDVFGFAQSELKRLGTDLGEVSPALNDTLQREAAVPFGYPLRGYDRITSAFGYRRNPFGWGFEFHNGLDFPAPYGTAVRSTGTGVVVEAGWKGSFGNAVVVDHGYGYRTLYGHMSKLLVEVGARVERGDVIGLVGSTGRSTGSHVHYSVYQLGNEVNPKIFLY